MREASELISDISESVDRAMRSGNVKFTKVGGGDSEMQGNPLHLSGVELGDEEEETVEFHTLEIEGPSRDEERGDQGRGGRVQEGASSYTSGFRFSTGIASLDAYLRKAKLMELVAVGIVLLILFVAVIVVAATFGNGPDDSGTTTIPSTTFLDFSVTAEKGGGAVATDSEPCSAVGVDVSVQETFKQCKSLHKLYATQPHTCHHSPTSPPLDYIAYCRCCGEGATR
jgi:hypothetical protein